MPEGRKKPRSKWTAEEREFDRIVAMCDSRCQLVRIEGRMRFEKFEARFTREEMERMWESIK